MSDHADLVRQFIHYAAEIHSGSDEAVAALDALVAERDSLIGDREHWRNRAIDAEAERDLARTKLMDMHTWGEEWKVKARTAEKERDAVRVTLSQTNARAEAAEAERDSVILAQAAINAQNDRLREALGVTKTAWTNHDGSITVQLDGAFAVEVGDEMEICKFVNAALAAPTKEDEWDNTLLDGLEDAP